MVFNQAKQGFTLIELLVVVLIIGILAAVALPQYLKAVLKSRLTHVISTMNGLQKSLDLYVLANGFPSEVVRFWGPSAKGELDIDISCDSIDGDACITKEGLWSVACQSINCFIDLYGSSWLEGQNVAILNKGDGVWKLYRIPVDKTARQIICQWWVDTHGKEFDDETVQNVTASCAQVGVQ